MKAWSGSSKDIEWISKRTAPVFVFFAAVAALVKLIGGPTWVLIVLAAIAVVGPIADWLLKGRERSAQLREERASLWLEAPVPVGSLVDTDGFYRLGVETEAREALEAAGLRGSPHAPYVKRDVDETQVRPALRAAAEHDGASLIVVAGPSKAGKSRTLLEGAAATLPNAWLLVPKDAAALGRLAREPPPLEIAALVYVIWLDDIEPWVRPGDAGLSQHTLTAFEQWERPVLVLGTAGGKGRLLAGKDAERFADPIGDLLTAYPPIRLSSRLSANEQRMMSQIYEAQVISRIAEEGIGEYMIVAQRLIDRLEYDRECPEGVAVARAAIDWRRTGLLRSVPSECLRRLYRAYLPGPDTAARFELGLLWATKRQYSHVALIQGNDPYDPYDYLVEYSSRSGSPVPAATWDAVIEGYASVEELGHTVGPAAFLADELDRAETAFRRADEAGNGGAAFNHGVLLEQRGDHDGAEAAWRRADERGDGGGAASLGIVLAERGDPDGAEAAFRRAEERGDRRGRYNRGVLLAQRGELDAAEVIFRDAGRGGDGAGARSLGLLLAERGDVSGAEAAFRRADELEDGAGAYHLGALLEQRDELACAEAAYRRGAERGDGNSATNLGMLCVRRHDLDGAEAAFRRADELGHGLGAYNLSTLLGERGDSEGAEAAARRADERGTDGGSYNLGLLLLRRGDMDGGWAALRRADERGHGGGATLLGMLLAEGGDRDGAKEAFHRGDERGDGLGAYHLGVLLMEAGDLDGARAAFQRAVNSADQEAATAASTALQALAVP